MGGQTISNSETKVEAIKLQSSSYGVTVPAVWGVTKIAGNLLWYGGFKAIPHTEQTAGKGGGVKTQNTTYTYQAGVQMGLCHGPVSEIPRIWAGKKLYTGGWLPTQVADTPLFELHLLAPADRALFQLDMVLAHEPAVAITYCFLWEQGVKGNHLSEGKHWNLTPEGRLRVYPSRMLADGMYTPNDGRTLQVGVQYRYALAVRPATAADKLGMSWAKGTADQAIWSHLALAAPDDAVHHPGLAWVGASEYDLGSGGSVENHNFEVAGRGAYHLGATVPDVAPDLVLRDMLLNSAFGAGWSSARLGDLTDWNTYCVAAGLLISPALTEQVSAAAALDMLAKTTNSAVLWSDGKIKLIPYGDEPETGNGRQWTPNRTPVYHIDAAEHCVSSFGDNTPPVRVSRRRPADLKNQQRVQFRNRFKNYDIDVIEDKDQAAIDTEGLNAASSPFDAPWICHDAAARRLVALRLHRGRRVEFDCQFRLPGSFALLEPLDLLTLTSEEDGFTRKPVLITEIQETEDGDLDITAEDYPPGVCSAPLYDAQTTSGFLHDYNAAPGNAQAPIIIEAPGELSSSGLELYVAAYGTDPAWGGCTVWVSVDGLEYRKMGTLRGGTRMGTVAAATAATTSLAVRVGAQQQLHSASTASADALETLCYLIGAAGREYITYRTATLTSAGAYTLVSVVRGLYGSPAIALPAGGGFVRLDDSVAKSGPLSTSLIGKTVQIKLTSFNIYGGAEQSLADVQATPYLITGSMYAAWLAQTDAASGARVDLPAPLVLTTTVPSPDTAPFLALRTDLARQTFVNRSNQRRQVEAYINFFLRVKHPAVANGSTTVVPFFKVIKTKADGSAEFVPTWPAIGQDPDRFRSVDTPSAQDVWRYEDVCSVVLDPGESVTCFGEANFSHLSTAAGAVMAIDQLYTRIFAVKSS